MIRRLVLVAAVLLAASVAQAKPLYITVPRAFSPQEKPTVDVAFGAKESVELRVTKPTDLAAFIRSQSNLRRAYETPPVTVNPGRYLGRGLDAVRSPGRFWRLALNENFREAIAPGLPPVDPAAPKGVQAQLAEAPPKLIGLPPGTTLVQSQWLNLDLGGDDVTFNVPGFNAWFASDRLEQRQITLDPLPAGLYVLQLVQGRVEGQVVLLVTDLTMQVKQTDGEVLIRVAGRDQRPRAGAKVAVYLPNGQGPTGTTDENGEVKLPATSTKLLVTASVGDDTALVDTDFYSTLAATPDVFLYSDRPIYRPGDAVQFRGIVRQPDSFLARLFKPKHRTVSIQLEYDAKATSHIQTTAEVDEFGAFSGKLTVPEDAEANVVRVVATLDSREHQSEARVRKYVKPTFFVEVLGDEETVTPGQKIHAKIRARRYAGGPATNTAYEVALYRSLLDSPSWVDDAGMGGKGSAVTYGTASTTEGKLSAPERLYSSVVARAGEYGDNDPWASAAKFDENGEAEVEVEVPALKPGEERFAYRYTLSIFARDDQGTFANASKGFILSPTDVMGALSTNARLVMSGAEATLAVRSTAPSGRVIGETDGEVEFALIQADGSEKSLDKKTFKTGADGIWRGPIPTSKVGVVLSRVALFDKQKRKWEGETKLLVAHGSEPIMQVPALTLETTGGIYKPGDTGEVVVLLPEHWGPEGQNKGPIWVTLSGAGIYSTQLVQLDGTTYVHHFPIEKRFGSAVYAAVAYPTASGRWEERVIPFRIVPPQRSLTVQVQPGRAEAQPLGQQTIDLRVLDSAGHGVVAEVSVGVVDKAIYALQSEFRPAVLDFFYPIVRDNVTSFYSAEFQGYGYGDVLAQARSRLHPYEFAAIKPPSRKARNDEADTAYWNPAIVTDSEGHASITFTLPSNQTLWTITAVAADASGRFGEGTSEFASRGQMTLTTALPQFLREGDEAQGSIRLARGGEATAFKDLNVRLDIAGALASATNQSTVSLVKDGEQLIPVSLKASKDGAAEVRLAVAGMDAIADRKTFPIRSATVMDEIAAHSWGGGPLALNLPAGATVKHVELSLQPSTVAAALASVQELMTYPYGCLEQLVSTTVPNVAVYRTLDKVGGLASLDAEGRALLEMARSRAVQGTARILDLSLKTGGFTWFNGYSTPSAPLTLIALDGLAYAADAGLVDRNDGRITSAEGWISGQSLPQELEATRTYVLARLQHEKAAPNVREYLEKVPPNDPYAASLAVLAAYGAGIQNEPAVTQRLASLVQFSSDAIAKPPSILNVADFWGYPLRPVGLTAVLTHAASTGQIDLPAARRRLIEALADPEISTFERSTALLHSLWLVELDAKEMKTLTPPVVKASGTVDLRPHGGGLRASLNPSERNVEVASFDGVASLRAQVELPVTSLQPEVHGMLIKRAYYALRGSSRVRLQPGDSVSQGEDVYVELTLDAHADARIHDTRSAYYVVEDSVPAGFMALDEDKQYRGAPFSLPLTHEALRKRTLASEHATFFFEEPTFWSDSPRTIGYVMRAQFPGKFLAPPATVEDMYVHAFRGRTAPETLTVVASGAAKP